MGIDKPVVITPEKVAEALDIVRDEQYEPGKKYLGGIIMGGSEFARLRWDEVKYNEYRDPCMMRQEAEVNAS